MSPNLQDLSVTLVENPGRILIRSWRDPTTGSCRKFQDPVQDPRQDPKNSCRTILRFFMILNASQVLITGSSKRESCKVLIKGFNKEFLPGSLAEHPIHHLVHSDILHRMLGIHAVLLAEIFLRRISCHGRNHSQASCEHLLTIFLCCQHHSEYSLFGSTFSTNLLFVASKCHITIQQRGSSRCSKWPNRMGSLQW